MKTKFKLTAILILAIFSSCVELPDLIPSGNGDNSDMVIVELNTTLGNTQNVVVDDLLTLDFTNTYIVGYCADLYFEVTDGDVLTQVNESPVVLSEGDLVGGIIEGYWKNKCYVFNGIQFYPSCLRYPTFNYNEDTVVGIRFRVDGKLHYGWVILFVDSNGSYTLKAVGYNKLPGVNVRIGV